MEDYIIYIVIAISAVASIYKNFKKQQEANEKRVIGTPAPKPQTIQEKSAPAPTLFQTKPKVAPKPAPAPDKNKSLIESDIEQLKKNRGFVSSMEYTSLESSIGNYSSLLGDSSLHVPMEENFESFGSIEDDVIKDEEVVIAKPYPLFAGKDDFRKAIIYSAVFERKYA